MQPTQETNLGTYSFSGAPVVVTVGATGTYDIDAFGAQGGASSPFGGPGGYGAEEGGTFELTANERLEIVVGGAGGSANYGFGGGGGGGTFVLANTGAGGAYVPLLIAGGGGGAYGAAGGAGYVGAPGSGAGGSASGRKPGGGGSGVKGYGAMSNSGGGGGRNLGGGYAGGTGGGISGYGNGGFGGGGGGAYGGGGGGGYSGGSGNYGQPGGGGTSFDGGTAIDAQTIGGVQSGNGSLIITPSVACYCVGTLILTDRGEMPVEVLAIGDMVVTAGGEHRAVRWLGRRSYAGRFLAANPAVQPIRFRTGSLGGGLPRRSLLVSPKHAMLLDGMLIPANCLVNGSTIVQERGLERVDYHHVELDGHDVLLAEGAPSESFLDDDSRGMFHNAAEFAALYPDAGKPGGFCAPRLEQGAPLEAIRRRLADVASGLSLAA